ncbi:hypothetical protein B9Z55_022113 [Caenorhabditis nigoni]|nr:hypothetical protein B9Z55_022113 [Caenorhabditis nigoni]
MAQFNESPTPGISIPQNQSPSAPSLKSTSPAGSFPSVADSRLHLVEQLKEANPNLYELALGIAKQASETSQKCSFFEDTFEDVPRTLLKMKRSKMEEDEHLTFAIPTLPPNTFNLN